MFDWPPRIVETQCGKTLWQITNILEDLFRQESLLPPARIDAHFGELRRRLGRKVEHVVRRKQFALLVQWHRGAPLGAVLRGECFTRSVQGGRTITIVKWWSAAMTRLRKRAGVRRPQTPPRAGAAHDADALSSQRRLRSPTRQQSNKARLP